MKAEFKEIVAVVALVAVGQLGYVVLTRFDAGAPPILLEWEWVKSIAMLFFAVPAWAVMLWLVLSVKHAERRVERVCYGSDVEELEE